MLRTLSLTTYLLSPSPSSSIRSSSLYLINHGFRFRLHITKNTMSGRRSSGSRISDDQIIRLVAKLQQQVPELRNRRTDKVAATKVLSETCNYIRNLQREVDDLSDRLTLLLSTLDANSEEASIIRSLLN